MGRCPLRIWPRRYDEMPCVIIQKKSAGSFDSEKTSSWRTCTWRKAGWEQKGCYSPRRGKLFDTADPPLTGGRGKQFDPPLKALLPTPLAGDPDPRAKLLGSVCKPSPFSKIHAVFLIRHRPPTHAAAWAISTGLGGTLAGGAPAAEGAKHEAVLGWL